MTRRGERQNGSSSAEAVWIFSAKTLRKPSSSDVSSDREGTGRVDAEARAVIENRGKSPRRHCMTKWSKFA